jgi:hypothetical protein
VARKYKPGKERGDANMSLDKTEKVFSIVASTITVAGAIIGVVLWLNQQPEKPSNENTRTNEKTEAVTPTLEEAKKGQQNNNPNDNGFTLLLKRGNKATVYFGIMTFFVFVGMLKAPLSPFRKKSLKGCASLVRDTFGEDVEGLILVFFGFWWLVAITIILYAILFIGIGGYYGILDKTTVSDIGIACLMNCITIVLVYLISHYRQSRRAYVCTVYAAMTDLYPGEPRYEEAKEENEKGHGGRISIGEIQEWQPVSGCLCLVLLTGLLLVVGPAVAWWVLSY